jgi:transcriptional regulator with XRE-family HTH domain
VRTGQVDPEVRIRRLAAPTTAPSTRATLAPGAGRLVREWRIRRGLSQLKLAGLAQTSTRHLSFVESGRARASREFLAHLAHHLDVPADDTRRILLAAGYAPMVVPSSPAKAQLMEIRPSLDAIVQGHDPYPAWIVDGRWNIVVANDATSLLTESVARKLLDSGPNALRIALHPDGVAARVENLASWAAALLDRLDRQVAVTGDAQLAELASELRSYPGVPPHPIHTETHERLQVELALRAHTQRLRLFSSVATFGSALDLTMAELSIEVFLPADRRTAKALHARADESLAMR